MKRVVSYSKIFTDSSSATLCLWINRSVQMGKSCKTMNVLNLFTLSRTLPFEIVSVSSCFRCIYIWQSLEKNWGRILVGQRRDCIPQSDHRIFLTRKTCCTIQRCGRCHLVLRSFYNDRGLVSPLQYCVVETVSFCCSTAAILRCGDGLFLL